MYKFIKAAALIAFVIALSLFCYTELQYKSAETDYSELVEEAVIISAESPKSESQPEQDDNITDNEPLLEIDHSYLSEINGDYVCWLSACGNEISYPVVKGADNNEYLHKTFYGKRNFSGCLFMDHQCSGIDDFHVLIYGHSMKDRTMFRLIADYTNKTFADQYPYFYIYTPTGRYKYEIFSIYDMIGSELLTALNDPTQEDKEAFIKALKEKSIYDYDVTPNADDNIVSLITCDVRDDSKRVVVNAKRIAD